MPRSILVINPNSSLKVTQEIDEAVGPLRTYGETQISVMGIAEGPAGIQTQNDVEAVVPLIVKTVQEREAHAYVIACYSDPGLYAAREATKNPVYGIAESAMLTAMMLGQRFGIISILQASIPRHLRQIGSMGISSRFAGDRPLGLTVAELSDKARTLKGLLKTGAELRDQDGADVLILGCAGMAALREQLETELKVPVVDPCQAAVSFALGRLYLS